ncbi:MAG: 4'-phosphopantetheinyl transferase superfamily protein [Ferruginibacter sp.]
MNSAGNDIISLNHIDSGRTKQERFYSKFLLPAEVDLYDNNHLAQLSFENFIWLLWSVKESVYKFCKRHSPKLVFSPGKINVSIIQAPAMHDSHLFGTGEITDVSFNNAEYYQCTVTAGNEIFYSRSKVYQNIIHTVVNNRDCFDSMYWGIKYIEDSNPAGQSESVRLFILKTLKNIYPHGGISIIVNDADCPVIKMNEAETNIPVSFTHHDKYVAYAFNLLDEAIPKFAVR